MIRRGAAVLALGLLIAGCGDSGGGTGGDTNSNDGDQTSSPAGQGGFGGQVDPGCGPLAEGFADPECASCAEASCCDELLGCDDIAACPDLDACLTGACAEACAVPTGICDTDFTTFDPACDECLGGACCAELQACAADPVCSACLADAGAAGCQESEPLSSMETCFGASCPQACDG
jgi:hypothetical protein